MCVCGLNLCQLKNFAAIKLPCKQVFSHYRIMCLTFLEPVTALLVNTSITLSPFHLSFRRLVKWLDWATLSYRVFLFMILFVSHDVCIKYSSFLETVQILLFVNYFTVDVTLFASGSSWKVCELSSSQMISLSWIVIRRILIKHLGRVHYCVSIEMRELNKKTKLLTVFDV